MTYDSIRSYVRVATLLLPFSGSRIQITLLTLDCCRSTVKLLPYIGPIVKPVDLVLKTVQKGTSASAKCTDYVTNLRLRSLQKNCNPAHKHVRETRLRCV